MIKLFIISILCTLIMFFILNILNNKFNFLSCNKYLLLSEIFIASIVIIIIVNLCHMLYGRDKFTTLQSYSINYQDKHCKIKIGQNLLDINSDKKNLVFNINRKTKFELIYDNKEYSINNLYPSKPQTYFINDNKKIIIIDKVKKQENIIMKNLLLSESYKSTSQEYYVIKEIHY